jgi:hypothetical protein
MRGSRFGTVRGHHSPNAGYLGDEDLVFVLDVHKKYGPWLVTPGSTRRWTPFDHGTKRGILVIE